MMQIIFFFILASLLTGCAKQPPEKQAVNVTAFQVESNTIPADFEFVGVAKSSHQVEIRSRVEGYLLSINYVEGSMVDENTLLFELDHRPFEASLEQSKGALARQEAVLWRAKRSLERIEPLYKQNAASLRDLDDATAAVLTAEATVIEAKANLIQAELNLSWSYISSPVHGWSGRALFRPGTLIDPPSNGLLTYVDIIDPIWVYFSISDNDLLTGRNEQENALLVLPKEESYTVSLQLANGEPYSYKGTVNFSSPILDPETATLNVRSQFPNPKGELLPSQFVRAKVSGAYRPHALVVPQEALFQGQNGRSVFLIGANNIVKMQPVQTLDTFKTYAIITGGLQAGDLIVANGVNKLLEGAEVHVTQTIKYAE